MTTYRKKPIVIDAVQICELIREDFSLWPGWTQTAFNIGQFDLSAAGANIETLEGVMFGNPDDFLIKGVQGELYPCKPDIFAATYDPIEDFQ